MGKPAKRTVDVTKSSVYRNYQKLLKKEGFKTAPASKKRSVDAKRERTNRLLKTHEKSKSRGNKNKEQKESREEREKARAEKQKMKRDRQKRINKRTKKGQPVMKDRVELMLEKIMKNKDTYQG